MLEELRQREPLFHRREFGTSVEDMLGQTDEQFWEVGASGRRYSRESCAATRAERWQTAPEPWEGEGWSAGEFCCQELAPDLNLVTYNLRKEERLTRRASIWRRAADRWLIVYHQGTVVADA